MAGGLLIIALLLAHIFLVALFIIPPEKLLTLIVKDSPGFLTAEEIPVSVETFLITNKITVEGDYQFNSGNKGKLISGVLQFRRVRFMNDSERLALDMNLLNYGEGIIGLRAASEYYYKKPLTQISEKDWVMLVHLQKIFSKK